MQKKFSFYGVGSGRDPARVLCPLRMNRLISTARHIAHRLWIWNIGPSLRREDRSRLFGLDLIVLPGVLNPRHFRSSRLLAKCLIHLNLKGKQVLDLGTGSGLLALLAARAGAAVTALDVNPAAVQCATENARRNRLSERVRVGTSDVFDSLPPGPQFDWVVTNPPFYSRAAVSLPDHAFASGEGNEFFVKLAHGLPERLAPGGALLLVLSSDTNFSPIQQMLRARGMTERTLAKRRGLFETLTVMEFAAVRQPE